MRLEATYDKFDGFGLLLGGISKPPSKLISLGGGFCYKVCALFHNFLSVLNKYALLRSLWEFPALQVINTVPHQGGAGGGSADGIFFPRFRPYIIEHFTVPFEMDEDCAVWGFSGIIDS